MNIYVASSWRNELQPSVVQALRQAGHSVYDFRHPTKDNSGFHWSAIDSNWQQWSPGEFRQALKHPIAVDGFGFDMDALSCCDCCVLVLPCGRSAHLELGWAVGAGRDTYVLMTEPSEPELMYKMCTGICTSLEELITTLE